MTAAQARETQRLLDTLTPAQRGAVDHERGHIALVTVPGGGKTTALTARLVRLLQKGVAPSRVCACTYTREAANEILRRVVRYDLSQGVRVGTVHSVSLEVLRSAPAAWGRDYTVDDGKAYRKLIQRALAFDLQRPVGVDPDGVQGFIDRAKARGLYPIGFGADDRALELRDFAAITTATPAAARLYLDAYRIVERARIDQGLLTFADMPLWASVYLTLEPAAQARWGSAFDHVIVDEAQDSTPVELTLIFALAKDAQSLALILDGNQSLYGWRGAAPALAQAFVNAPTTTVYRARETFRVPPRICEAANRLIAGRPWNQIGEMVPQRLEPGEVLTQVYADSTEEANAVVGEIRRAVAAGARPSTWAILARTHNALRACEDAIRDSDVPYVSSGPSFYGRREIKDVTAYLRVIALQDDHLGSSARRIANVPFRYLGRQLLDGAQYEARRRSVPFLDALATYRVARPAARRSIRDLIDLLRVLHAKVAAGDPPSDVIECLLARTNYIEWITRDAGDGGVGGDAGRATTIHEFLRLSRDFGTVGALLTHVDRSLRLAADRRPGREVEAVTISTIHAVKGREFECVFIVGAADGILPIHTNPDPDEERRLMYVAITRARRRVTISYPQVVTTLRGMFPAAASPFLAEMGVAEMGVAEVARRHARQPTTRTSSCSPTGDLP